MKSLWKCTMSLVVCAVLGEAIAQSNDVNDETKHVTPPTGAIRACIELDGHEALVAVAGQLSAQGNALEKYLQGLPAQNLTPEDRHNIKSVADELREAITEVKKAIREFPYALEKSLPDIQKVIDHSLDNAHRKAMQVSDPKRFQGVITDFQSWASGVPIVVIGIVIILLLSVFFTILRPLHAVADIVKEFPDKWREATGNLVTAVEEMQKAQRVLTSQKRGDNG